MTEREEEVANPLPPTAPDGSADLESESGKHHGRRADSGIRGDAGDPRTPPGPGDGAKSDDRHGTRENRGNASNAGRSFIARLTTVDLADQS